MTHISKHNPRLTFEYLQSGPEDLYFDRKSKRKKPNELANHICAFANANGGTIAVGVEDSGVINGFTISEQQLINDIEKIPYDLCTPTPLCTFEVCEIKDDKNIDTKILLIHVKASTSKVIRKTSGEVFLRIGDSSKKLHYEDIKNLEYDRGERLYEEEIVERATLNDIDVDLFNYYKKLLDTDLSIEEILDARGLIVYKDNQTFLTVAGVLLFCKYPEKFLPTCRLRFIRYDGITASTGTSMNIIKDKTIYGPLHKILTDSKALINSQLRDFQSLDPVTGTFKTVPEYPEFAWQEGIVNALTHRDYSLKGEHIRVTMYDDRLEITSPGKLPNIVTLSNLKSTRYSRNPKIARVLSEFGWVKELNEGVKRIYNEMKNFFLDDPIFSEPNKNSLNLTLKNNIVMRRIRSSEQLRIKFSDGIWNSLSSDEQTALSIAFSKNQVTTTVLANELNRSSKYCRNILKRLTDEKKLLKWSGTSSTDPHQFYSLNID